MSTPEPEPIATQSVSTTTAEEMLKKSTTAIGASIVRTAVPWLVGIIVSALAHFRIEVGNGTVELFVDGLLAFVVGLAYYVGARLLEIFHNSKWGWLLGFAKSPQYLPKGQ